MDTVTLIIHEAGHTIFGVFGWRFLTILGGTLMQLIIPLLIVLYGFINKQYKTTQCAFYWLGFAWLDTAVYAADAYYKQLPLLGNLPKSSHDFGNLLSQLQWLDHYKSVAWVLYTIGCLMLIIAIIWPIFSDEDIRYVDLNLDL